MTAEKGTKTRKGKGVVPRLESLDEESDFWDTHSFLDFGNWEVVPFEEVCGALACVRGPKIPVTFRLERDLVRVLKDAARQYGVKYQVLVREILWRSLSRHAGPRRRRGRPEARQRDRM